MPLKIVKTTIGNADITQIVELEISPLMGVLIPDATPEKVKEIDWLTAPHITEDYTLNAVSQCFVVRKGERLFVVDTCIGNEKELAAFPMFNHMNLDFLASLEAAGIDRNSVTDVICTHLHFDHVGWNTYMENGEWQPTFPNAKYHFAQAEYDYFVKLAQEHNPADTASLEAGHISALNESVRPVIAAGLANFIEVNADLGDGFSVFPTPGHSFAHVCLRVEAGEAEFILAGDVMHHPCQIAQPAWASASDYDKNQSTETRRKLFAELSSTSTLLAGTHFMSPSFGLIKRGEADGFVFVSPLAAT